MPLSDSILVVDDDADRRETLVEYLLCKGFAVHAAPTGATAVDLADVLYPRVVLIDLDVPTLDGLETTRRLRADARLREATIVAVTAGSCATDREAAYRAGCNFFIPKPYDLTTFATFVDGLLSTSTARSGAPPRRPLNFAPQTL